MSLDQIPVEQLRPEFKQGVAALLQLIFAKVKSEDSVGRSPLLSADHAHANQDCTACWQSTSVCSCPQPFIAVPSSKLLWGLSLLLSHVQAQPRSYGTLGVMSGPLLAGLTGAYVSAINAGAVPTIATAWQVRGC